MSMDELVKEYRGIRFTMRSLDDGREHFLVERITDGNIMTSTLYGGAARDGFDALVEGWVDARLGVVPAKTVHCADCGTALKPEFDYDTEYQFDNALWVGFSGGYGMFIDPFGEKDPKAVICHECAHALCAAHPWIEKLLDPHNSHAHSVHTIPDLLKDGHKGWDLEKHDQQP